MSREGATDRPQLKNWGEKEHLFRPSTLLTTQKAPKCSLRITRTVFLICRGQTPKLKTVQTDIDDSMVIHEFSRLKLYTAVYSRVSIAAS